jgi:hypothetical protein
VRNVEPNYGTSHIQPICARSISILGEERTSEGRQAVLLIHNATIHIATLSQWLKYLGVRFCKEQGVGTVYTPVQIPALHHSLHSKTVFAISFSDSRLPYEEFYVH